MTAADWHLALATNNERNPMLVSCSLLECNPGSGSCLLLMLSDDVLLEVCFALAARTCASMRMTCRRLRLLLPRPHVFSLDVRVFPKWESTLALSRGRYLQHVDLDFLPHRSTLRAPGGAVRIEIELEFHAVEMHTQPAVSLELCRYSMLLPTSVSIPAVVEAIFPLPLVNLDPSMARANLPCRQRAHIVLGPDSLLVSSSRVGDVYRLMLDDIPHAPPMGSSSPWRFVKASRVLSCRMIVIGSSPLPPPCMDR